MSVKPNANAMMQNSNSFSIFMVDARNLRPNNLPESLPMTAHGGSWSAMAGYERPIASHGEL